MAEWLQEARKKMEKKGTVGKFGKATEKKIAGKKKGGVKKKEAVFAQNMKKLAAKRKKKGRKKRGRGM